MPDSYDTGVIPRDLTVAAASPFSAEVAAAPTVLSPARRKRRGYRLISPIVLVAVWQLASSTGILPTSKLVSPASIAHTAYDLIVHSSPLTGRCRHRCWRPSSAGPSASRSASPSPCCSPSSPG